MTHIVISQTWLKPEEEHLEGYLDAVARHDGFLRSQPGFVSRQLVRSLEDPRHLIHLRVFASVGDYEAMTRIPAYRAQITELSQFVDPAAYPAGVLGREYGEIVFSTSSP